jgi:hypothetical protein
MTIQVKEEILHILAELSECCPEVRFGQLIANLSYLAKGPTAEAIWDVEDQELLEAARKHLKDLRDRGTPVTNRRLDSDEALGRRAM